MGCWINPTDEKRAADIRANEDPDRNFLKYKWVVTTTLIIIITRVPFQIQPRGSDAAAVVAASSQFSDLPQRSNARNHIMASSETYYAMEVR
jgi:hypothetical protein